MNDDEDDDVDNHVNDDAVNINHSIDDNKDDEGSKNIKNDDEKDEDNDNKGVKEMTTMKMMAMMMKTWITSRGLIPIHTCSSVKIVML